MSDEFKDYLTIAEAMKAVGCARRTLYRILERMEDGVVTHAFGKQLIHKSHVAALRKAYLPFGSERRSKAAQAWGAAGGTQKRINREKAAKKA
jgi:hypothetical protein